MSKKAGKQPPPGMTGDFYPPFLKQIKRQFKEERACAKRVENALEAVRIAFNISNPALQFYYPTAETRLLIKALLRRCPDIRPEDFDKEFDIREWEQ